MKYEYMANAPTCEKSKCFGFFGGHCSILCDNNFRNRSCPFFKTTEQKRQQEMESKERIKLLRKEMCGNG